MKLKRRLRTLAIITAAQCMALGSAVADDWKIGSPVRPPNIMSGFIDKISDGTAQATNGEINIELSHNFNEQAITDQLIRGRLQMAYVSAIGLSVAVPEMQVLAAPYVWDSEEQRNWVTDNKLLDTINSILEGKGLVLVRFGEAGWTNLYCKFACTEPSMMAGQKSRVSPNAASKAFWDQLDTNGVQLPLTETWPALQSGVVDMGDLTFSFYLITPAAEVAPHYVFTNHIHLPALFVANKRLWDGLSPETQQAIRDAAPTTDEMRQTIKDNEAVVEVEFQKNGGNTYRLTDEEKAVWKETIRPALPALIDSYGGRARELYDLIEEGKKEYAAL